MLSAEEIKALITKAGRNDRPCICGGTDKVKKCCWDFIEAYKKQQPSGDGTMKTFLDYEDLWRFRENNFADVTKTLNSYNALDAVQTLSKVNCLIFREDSTAAALFVLKNVLPEPYFLKVRFWMLFQLRSVVFSRQALLFAMQILITQSKNEGEKIMVAKNPEVLFDSILRLSSHVSTSQVANPSSSSILIKSAQAELISNAHLNKHNDLAALLGRAHLIFTEGWAEISQKYKTEKIIDINAKCQELLGFSIEECLILGFVLWINYGSKEIKELYQRPENFLINESFFSNFKNDELRQRAKNFFGLFASTIEDLRFEFKKDAKTGIHTAYAFRPFYDTPFIDLENGAYFLLDITFFQQRMTTGLAWLLNDQMKIENPKGHGLRSSFGRVTEWYMKKILDQMPLGQSKALYSEWNEEIKGCDFVYVEDGNVFVIEAKSLFLPIQKIVSGNPDIIENCIKDKWFAIDEHDRGDISKLSAFTANIKTNGLVSKNGDVLVPSTEIKEVWPVIVYFDSVPLHPAVWKLLDDILVENNIDQTFIDKFSILDIEELEMFCALTAKGISWRELFAIRRKDYNQWKTPPKNELLRRFGKVRRPKIVEDSYNALFDKAKKMLFKIEPSS